VGKEKSNFAEDTLRKLVDAGLGVAVTFVFSVALAGSSSFLLLDAQTELNRLGSYSITFQEDTAQHVSFNELSDTLTQGWISNTTNTE